MSLLVQKTHKKTKKEREDWLYSKTRRRTFRGQGGGPRKVKRVVLFSRVVSAVDPPSRLVSRRWNRREKR